MKNRIKVCHITTVHSRYDIRIFHKECMTLAYLEYDVNLVVCDNLGNEVLNGVHIYSVGKYKNRFERLLVYQKKVFNKVLEIKPQMIHFHDPELLFLANKLVRLGYIVIYDVHEDLPKQILNKYWIPKIFRRQCSILAKLLEKYYAKRFHGIITATEILKKRFIAYNNLGTITVGNYPLLHEAKFRETEINNETICYIGSISKSRGIIPLVESLAISKVTLKLAGPFSGDISLDDITKLSGGNFVEYLGILNRTQIVELLNTVSIGIVTLFPTPSYIESVPIKMFEYMMFKLPIIASNFTFWQQMLCEENCALFVNPKSKEEIANSCKILIEDKIKSKNMGENGYNAVIKRFNWNIESQKLKIFYEQLLKN